MKPAIGAATPIVPPNVIELPPESIVKLSTVPAAPSPTIVEVNSTVPSAPVVSVSISTAPEIITGPVRVTVLPAEVEVFIAPLKVIEVLDVKATVLIPFAVPVPIAPTASVPLPAFIEMSSSAVPSISPIEIFPALELIVRPVVAISIVPVEKLIVEEASVVVKLGSAPVKSIWVPLLDSTVTSPPML